MVNTSMIHTYTVSWHHSCRSPRRHPTEPLDVSATLTYKNH